LSGESFRLPDDRLIEVEPYRVLSGIYDQVMSHVDYSAWTDFVLDVLADHGLPSEFGEPPPTLLEAACGTGSTAIMIALRGYNVDAFDGSPRMIAAAEAKAKSIPGRPRFKVADFMTRGTGKTYDAILCLYDSVNYISVERSLGDFFKLVRDQMRPGGLFLFDVCTEYNSLRHFAGVEQVEYLKGASYQRVMSYDPRAGIQRNRFFIRLDKSPGDVYVEQHIQKIYSLETVRRQIARAGMDIAEETDNLIRKPPHAESTRVHFLCKRK